MSVNQGCGTSEARDTGFGAKSNSIYLHAGGADAFINPGSDAKYRRMTQPFLRYQGVNQLCLLPSCRQDADHRRMSQTNRAAVHLCLSDERSRESA